MFLCKNQVVAYEFNIIIKQKMLVKLFIKYA